MASSFVSGTVAIPVGQLEVSVTGLGLVFAPSNVVCNVRHPAGASDFISCGVIGNPTTDGFTVALSAPVSQSGYLIDYTVFAEGGISPVEGDTMCVSYGDLKNAVAVFLGYDATNLTVAQTSAIDSYIQSGVRNFYYPPKMEGVDENFEWSFIRQTGLVNVTAGVDSYALPNGFGRIAGQISVKNDEGPMIPVIPYGDIVRFRSRPESGRPRFAAIVCGKTFGSRGQLKQIHLFPTPDKAYELDFVCDADTGKLDASVRVFPLGGAMFSELVMESCLAIAEQRANDAEGLHTKKFNELLVSMIARDRKSSAQEFGDIGDPEARGLCEFRPLATRGLLY